MLKSYSKKSLKFAIIGITGQIVVTALTLLFEIVPSAYQAINISVALIQITFGILIIMGFWYYLKAKGRSPFWLILLFFNLIGIIIIASLKDKYIMTKDMIENHDIIVNVLKSNPGISYKDAKTQAITAGFSNELFEIAWKDAEMN